MKESSQKTNIALSVTLVFVSLLAGYVVFGVWQKDSNAGAAAVEVTDGQNESGPVDAVFVIDATSSMRDEIDQVREEVVGLANELANTNPDADIRFGLVLYKDKTDDFLVQKTELTGDVQKVRELLRNITVSGGGDYPEHVGAGLHEALGLSWRADARRIIYLVGDASSHDYQDGLDVESAIAQAVQQDVEIRSLGCSGIDARGGEGKREFGRIAESTGGTYDDLTYHAIIQNPDGSKRSVIYEGGSTYEADRVLEDDEWTRGGSTLEKEGLIKPASAESEEKARSRPKKSNALELIKGGLE